MIEQLDNKIKQNEEREYILERKCDLLEQNIQESEELFAKNSNLLKTRELEDIPNIKDVSVSIVVFNLFIYINQREILMKLIELTFETEK